MAVGWEIGELTPGRAFVVVFPFVRREDDGWHDRVAEWRPGVRLEPLPPYGESSEAVADGEGRMTITVVSLHKPGKYLERVFFTRKFIDPDGKSFGKGILRIAATEKFTRLVRSYARPYMVKVAEDA